MDVIIEILEEELKHLEDSINKFEKSKSKKNKYDKLIYNIIERWYKQDKEKIVSVKKAIKVLKQI